MKTAVKEKPILFSPSMVQVILAGRKTMTRRPMKPQPRGDHNGLTWGRTIDSWVGWAYGTGHCGRPHPEWLAACPYGLPGDRLWVKEASWAWGRWIPNGKTRTGRNRFRFEPIGRRTVYERPTGGIVRRDGSEGWVYRHARYMPRRASRITLEVTDVRIERLQEIRVGGYLFASDVQKEGCPFENDPALFGQDEVAWFSELWNKINGDGSWESDPFVWVVEFKKVKASA